ncbi:shikimate dehydrogenase [Rhizobium sp. CCGE 510]|uniref:shikimate dehydrogenase family protein n=1 Tax=Rhizobium sp. CCGE 510 TaxID=1132836 RepID=UPI001F0A3C03|nr:shikimate dehydrogenase [Rhizobium sp. CCGE 510]
MDTPEKTTSHPIPALDIDGATRLLFLIGDPISSVRSPALFNSLFEESKTNAVCIPLCVSAENLEGFWSGVRQTGNLAGLLVTMPHKRLMASRVDDLDPTAQQVGAINVARREANGRWRGAIFDGWGCVLGMLWEGNDPTGKRILLVGCGGAGSAIGFALAQMNPARLAIFDLDTTVAGRVAAQISAAFPLCPVTVSEPDPTGFDIVINATPLGMNPGDPFPVDVERLRPGMAVVDVVTKPDPTAFGLAARERGCRTQSGRAMHEGQAVYAAAFFGQRYWPPHREKVVPPGPAEDISPQRHEH